jgi:hypothetical protein
VSNFRQIEHRPFGRKSSLNLLLILLAASRPFFSCNRLFGLLSD